MSDNSAPATLTAYLEITCPKCNIRFDLFDGNNDDEGIYSRPIFNNSWDDLNGENVYCPKCDHKFTISEVEY